MDSITTKWDICLSQSSSSRHMTITLLGTYQNFLLSLTKPMHSVRVSINAGDMSYEVTAQRTPVFLYEDLDKYDPNKVFVGLLCGLFLVYIGKSQILMLCI